MLRERLVRRRAGEEEGFSWRGEDVSRLEGFSDAVFAFAVTLLVVSLEVPQTFDELLVAMRGFFAFAVCFALLFSVWHDHYIFPLQVLHGHLMGSRRRRNRVSVDHAEGAREEEGGP